MKLITEPFDANYVNVLGLYASNQMFRLWNFKDTYWLVTQVDETCFKAIVFYDPNNNFQHPSTGYTMGYGTKLQCIPNAIFMISHKDWVKNQNGF